MKLNTKKLSQFYANRNNSEQIKILVQQAVINFISEEVKNEHLVSVLRDLGLLIEK